MSKCLHFRNAIRKEQVMWNLRGCLNKTLSSAEIRAAFQFLKKYFPIPGIKRLFKVYEVSLHVQIEREKSIIESSFM